jgi:hypothetical protein
LQFASWLIELIGSNCLSGIGRVLHPKGGAALGGGFAVLLFGLEMVILHEQTKQDPATPAIIMKFFKNLFAVIGDVGDCAAAFVPKTAVHGKAVATIVAGAGTVFATGCNAGGIALNWKSAREHQNY